uniref:Uncharacterized protein n=1 Tax=Oryza nivara TaxID=4536 RepID=A0A0E0GAR8_ORYNI
MDSPSTNKQGPRAPSSQASPARFRFVIGADAVYRSTRLRRYGIRSEPHKMNGRLEMSTGPVASPSAIAARVAADDTRSSACPPRAAERRRRRGWKAVTLAWYVLSSSGLSRASGSASGQEEAGCHIYMGADKGWEFGCEATMFIVRSAFGRYIK